MTDDDRKLAEASISTMYLDDAASNPDSCGFADEEVYRLGLECANVRAKLAEAERLSGWLDDELTRERAAHHEWVAWARENGAVATGPGAESEARKMLGARMKTGQPAKKGEE